jgi:maleate cis-trans isomerase
MKVLERLERELGKPVLANNAVSLWAGLRLMQRADPLDGYGQLLRAHLGDRQVSRPLIRSSQT